MESTRGVLLTGATGFLGQYLLRDLLVSGHSLAVLARDSGHASATDRIAEIVHFWSNSLSTQLPQPVVLAGDLHEPDLGLGLAERQWLATKCCRVIHAAANVRFQPSPDGEPWATNVDGTRNLVHACQAAGLPEFHHVSTAFVCGDRPGPVFEHELDCGQRFHNLYEQSKLEAERLLRGTDALCVTVYRPTVIIGDSRTGRTCSQLGVYFFAELLDRLAGRSRGRCGPDSRKPSPIARSAAMGERKCRPHLPLRLPCSATASHNYVPVDWVSRAILHVVERHGYHGRTFHLAARQPVPARLVKEAIEDCLQVEGLAFVGETPIRDPSPAERIFLDQIPQYVPYMTGVPKFDCRNAGDALAMLPPPIVDRTMLRRTIQFALNHGRGMNSVPRTHKRQSGDNNRADLDSTSSNLCAEYLEQFFPEHAPQSLIAQVITLNLTVGFQITGPDGGHWLCRWVGGDLVEVRRNPETAAEVAYRTDVATFVAVVRGEIAPQKAFFDRRVEIEGDVEKALKLAYLFGEFVREFPFDRAQSREVPDVVRLCA